MPTITPASVADTARLRGDPVNRSHGQGAPKFALATLDKSPVPFGQHPYVPIGKSLFVPEDVDGAVTQPIYQSKDRKHYAVQLADERLAPVKVIEEASGGRRIFGLAKEWRWTGEGEHGFAMKRDNGAGPTPHQLRQLAADQPWNPSHFAGAPPDLQKVLDEWAADSTALALGEHRAEAKLLIERALRQDADPTVKSYRLGLGNHLLSEVPTEVLDSLTKCFEISLNGNRLTELKLNNPHVQRVLVRNNLIGKVELGRDMAGLKYLDLANNLLDKVPDSLASLTQPCEVFVPDNAIGNTAIADHNAGHAAKLVAARSRQTRQDLKGQGGTEIEAALKAADRSQWDQLITNLSQPQRAWLFTESAESMRTALKTWLGVDAAGTEAPQAPPQALACYVGALSGQTPEMQAQRLAALKLLGARLKALDDSAPGVAEQRAAVMIAVQRDASTATSSLPEQRELIGMLLEQLPHLLADDLVSVIDETQRMASSRWADVRGDIQDLLKKHFGRDAQLMQLAMSGGVVAKDHDADSVYSAGRTAFARLLDYELAQRGVEKQLREIWGDGKNEAAWLYLTHFKQTVQTIFESAEVLAANKRRADVKVDLSTLGTGVTEGSSLTSGTSGAVEVVAEVSSEVVKTFPFIGLAGSLGKLGLEHRATLKYHKEGERIRHQLDRPADTHDLFADTLSRAMTTLRMDELRKVQLDHEKTAGKGKSVLQRLPDAFELRLRKMGVGSSVDPKEPALARAMREMATEDAKGVVEAMTKGKIEMPATTRPFGNDPGKLAPVLHWFGKEQLGIEDAAVMDKVLEATPWGVVDAQITRDEIKAKYDLQITKPRTPSHTSGGSVSTRTTVKWEHVEMRVQRSEGSWKLQLDDSLAQAAATVNDQMGKLKGELDTTKGRQTTVETRLDEQGTKLIEQDGKLRRQDDDLNRLTEQVGGFEEDLDDKADKTDVVRLERAQLETAERLDGADTDAQVLADQVGDAIEQIDNLDTEVIVQGATIEELETRVQRKAGQGQLNALAGEVAAVQQSVATLSARDLDSLRREGEAQKAETQRKLDRKVGRGEIEALASDMSKVQQSVAQLSTHGIDLLRRENETLRTETQTLRAENQTLRQALQAQQRHSARIEVRTNLTRLTPEQTLEALQVYFSLDETSAVSRSFVRNPGGEVTHLRGWSGLRRSLPNTLQSYHPNGCTLADLSTFLARQGMAVRDPDTLQNAIFAVLGIAEPAVQP